MIFAQVIVRPRTSIFDPQGEAVKQAIQSLGLSSVREAHVGKCIELQLDTDNVEEARAALEVVCKDLLSNPVIEEFELKVQAGSKSRSPNAVAPRRPALPKSAAKTVAPRKLKKPVQQVLEVVEEDDAETLRIKALKKQEKAAKKLAKDAKKAAKRADKQVKELKKNKKKSGV